MMGLYAVARASRLRKTSHGLRAGTVGSALAAALILVSPAAAQTESTGTKSMSATELFGFADAQRAAGKYAVAETAYRALSGNPDPDLRNEARFRLGMMLADDQHKYREAAVEFRRILDDRPHAARVRLELARMDALLGNTGAAQRELRAAQSSGLPADVARLVRFYSSALAARKPWGASVEVAVAPDSNINRATKSDTLGTVIGDLTLDRNARARSGIGAALRGQTYWRAKLGQNIGLLAKASGSADLYRESQFDDVGLSLQAGPEYVAGKDRFTLAVGPGWRWYGLRPYSTTLGGTASYQHPLGTRAQLRVDGSIASIDNKLNDLQDSASYALAVAVDRSFSARFGGGVELAGSRDAARDAGYATAGGGATVYIFREMGRTTAVATLGYAHLEADKRLFLYPERRVDDRFSASLSGTFRSLRIGPFAPLAKLRWERNKSRVGLYDYSRLAMEIGISAAF